MRNFKLTLSNGKRLLFTLLRFDVKMLLLVKLTIWSSFFINTICSFVPFFHFLLKIRKKVRMFADTTSIQHCIDSSSRCNELRSE